MLMKLQELPTAIDLDSNPMTKKIKREPIVEWKGVRAHLDPQERSIWLLLTYGKGYIISFEQLENSMYRKDKTRSKKETQRLILRVKISCIRKKLKANIVTVPKLGYVLDPEEV